ncbi:MAG TPA: hypothetical protein VGL09_07840 [Methylomirabilota bacterium]|jgi:hypothetical protein
MVETVARRFLVRAEWMAEACLWAWEIVDTERGEVVENSWTATWTGYQAPDDAVRAGLTRLAEISRNERGAVAPRRAAAVDAPPTFKRLLIVPRVRIDLYHSLKKTFGGHDSVEVILDRRFAERRTRRVPDAPDRRRGDRRVRTEKSAEIVAGRVATVRVEESTADRARRLVG